jgi:hypothetical protein
MNNPNENVRTYMTMALVEDHSLRIDRIIKEYGWVNDMAKVPDKVDPAVNHLFSVKAPAVSYAGVPFYWVFTKVAPLFKHAVPTITSTHEEKVWWVRSSTLVLRLFTIQIPCFLFLVWLERWLRATTKDLVLRLTAVAAVALGTNYLAYAMTFASHAPFAIAAFGSFAVTSTERIRAAQTTQRSPWAVALGGVAGVGMGLGALFVGHVSGESLIPWFAVPMALGALGLLVMLGTLTPDEALRCRPSRALLAGFLAGMATLLEYHALPVSVLLSLYAMLAFWRPRRLVAFGLGGAFNAAVLMLFQWRAFGSPFTPGHRMSENPAFARMLNKGLFGIGTPSVEVASKISLSHTFGFFGTSPYMTLGLLAIPCALFFPRGTKLEKREERVRFLGWALTMLILWTTVSAAINWRGGWTVGPRYLGAAPPFFAYGAVVGLERLSGASAIRRTVARAVAGGTVIASAIQMGLVSLLVDAIPDSVSRPLPQLALPLARAGFVPHHVGELFGWVSPWFWYGVAASAALAVLLAALVPAEDKVTTWLLRAGLVVAVAVVALVPAFSEPRPDEKTDLTSVRYFTDGWEPRDRDFVHTTRDLAEHFGASRPCLWYRVADLERIVRSPAADRDEARATVPREACR